MVSIKNIADGWINYIKDKQPNGISSELKDMASSRAQICKECPSLMFSEKTVMGKLIFKFKCQECGCAFPMMTYAKNKKCPKRKWPDDTGS